MFRHETSTVVDKYRPSKSSESSSMLQIQPELSSLGFRRSSNAQHSIDTEIMNVALSFLYTEYLKDSSFTWIPIMSNLSKSTIFASMVRATALAAYANQKGYGEHLNNARALYNGCLSQLRTTVSSSSSVDDDILATVLLMSRFETLAMDGNEESIVSAWASHTYGAYNLLVSYRSTHSSFDDISKMLNSQILQNYRLYLHYLANPGGLSNSMIPELLESPLKIQKYDELEQLKHRSQRIVDRFWNLSRDLTSTHPDMILENIRLAQNMDQDIMVLMQEMALKIPFQHITSKDTSDSSNERGQCIRTTKCAYGNHREASLWNNMRMLRLSLHDSISEATQFLESPELQTYLENDAVVPKSILQKLQLDAETTNSVLADEICDSASYFLREGHPACTHTSASYLIWPLFVAAKACHNKRQVVEAHLHWISDKFKIRAARLALKNLDEVRYREDWLYVTHTT